MTKYNWLSREEWAKHRRTDYYDETPILIGVRLADYASPTEIEAAIAELEARWKWCGREMKAAKEAAGLLVQQPGETQTAWVQRYLATMSKEEQDLASRPEDLRRERKRINHVLRQLRDGDDLDWQSRTLTQDTSLPMLNRILEHWGVLWQQAYDTRQQEIANTPIDDEAWEDELKRRAEIENPEIERVCVGISVMR
jgi:hypothetical protein